MYANLPGDHLTVASFVAAGHNVFLDSGAAGLRRQFGAQSIAGGGTYGNGLLTAVNFVADAQTSNDYNTDYYALMGWWNTQRASDNGGAVGGFASCNRTVGGYRWGAGAAMTFLCPKQGAAPRPFTEALWEDNVMLNAMAAGGFWIFQVNTGIQNWPGKFRMNRNIFHWEADAGNSATLLDFINGTAPGGVWDINNLILLQGNTGASGTAFAFETNSANAVQRFDAFGPNIYLQRRLGIPVSCADASTGAVFIADAAECKLKAAYLPTSGLDGWNDSESGGVNRAFAYLHNGLMPANASAYTASRDVFNLSFSEWPGGVATDPLFNADCTPETCSVEDAMPEWSGPIAYEWPFAWITLDPVPGFRRTKPQSQYIPSCLREAAGVSGGGGGLRNRGPSSVP
jgi:hypothetical protein